MISISVVIPTLDEAGRLGRAIESIGARDGVEVIVADGGSTDGTQRVARAAADRVVAARRGRARQLNAGARLARGEVLLFLHADSILGPGATASVRRAMARPATVLGAFALRVDSRSRALRCIARAVNLRSRLLRLPYGDQALFVRREVFRALGGFRELEIMEDVDFVRRARRRGGLALVGPPVCTSDRRWRANGVLRTTAVNLGATAMFALAVPPRWIRATYDRLLAPAS